MAIYRPPKPRWRAVAMGLALGLLVGGSFGFAIGKPNEPNLDEAVGAIRAALARAAGSIEIAAIEYEEALEDGAVVARSEYEGALAAVASAQHSYRDVRDALLQLVPAKVTTIDAAFDRLVEAMRHKADPEEIARMVSELDTLLKECC